MSYLIIDGVKRPVMGWKKEPHDSRDLKMGVVAPHEFAALPPAGSVSVADLPPQWTQSNQDCVANSATEAFMFLQHKGVNDEEYSRIYVYAKARLLDGCPLTTDEGTYVRSAFNAISQNGICKESVFPYSTDVAAVPGADADAAASQHKALLYYRCPDLYTVKASILQGFPIVFGTQMSESMLSELGTTGLVHYPGENEDMSFGHAMLLIAFNDTEAVLNYTGSFDVRNSWGPNAGLKGNAKLRQKLFADGLATDCWTFRRAAL